MAPQHRSPSKESADLKWQRRPASRPREILDAAVAVFTETGYERATIAQVARRAGVSPALVVHYYRTKADLFEAVVNDRLVGFVAGEEALLASHRGSYRDLLHQLVRRLWDHLWTSDAMGIALVVKAERAHFPECTRAVFQQLGERWRRLLEGVLEAGARQGEFRVSGPHAARIVGAMVSGVVESTRCFGGVDPRPPSPDELWAAMTTLLDHGVLAQGEKQ
jgi:AcrR family transcriptional regulator